MVARENPCREVAFGRVEQAGVGFAFVFVHRDGDIIAVFFDAGECADFVEAGFPGFAIGHAAVERNLAGVGDGAAAGRGEEDFGGRDGAASEEVGFFPVGIVFFVEHLDEALDFGGVGGVIFVECADVADDVGHFVDGVVAAFGGGAVAAHAAGFDADFHTAAVTAIDAQAGRFGTDDEFGFEFVFINDVLPAEAVAVFFLDGAGDDERVIAFEAEVFDDFAGINHGSHAAFLIRAAAAPNRVVILFAFVGIAFGPQADVADADGVDVGVHRDDVLAVADVAEDVAHRVDFDLVKSDLFHFLFDAQNDFFFVARFAGDRDHVAQKLGHVGTVGLGFLEDLFKFHHKLLKKTPA